MKSSDQKIKKAFMCISREGKNSYTVETNTYTEREVPQCTALLLIGGSITASLIEGLQVGQDMFIDFEVREYGESCS